MLSSAAPSIRLKALSTPDSSHTAMSMGTPISVALASAAAMIRCARSVLTLAFWNTSLTALPFVVVVVVVGEALLQLADLADADEVQERVEAQHRRQQIDRRPAGLDLGQGRSHRRGRRQQRAEREDDQAKAQIAQEVMSDSRGPAALRGG